MMKKILLSLLFAAGVAHAQEPLMKKGEVTLTEAEVRAALSDLSTLQLTSFKNNPGNLTKYIENLFDNKYMASSVLEEIDQNAHFETIKDMNLNRFYISYYLKQKVKEEREKVGDLTDAAKLEYEANPEKYSEPERVDMYHILFVKYDDSEAMGDAKAKAEEVLAAIRAGEMTMAEAAKTYRTPLSGTNADGMITKLDPVRLAKPIEEVVVSLDIGEVPDIIEDDSGYHIVSVTERYPGGVVPYNPTLERGIIEELEASYESRVIQNTRARFQGPEGLEFNKEKLDALFEEFAGVTPSAEASKAVGDASSTSGDANEAKSE